MRHRLRDFFQANMGKVDVVVVSLIILSMISMSLETLPGFP